MDGKTRSWNGWEVASRQRECCSPDPLNPELQRPTRLLVCFFLYHLSNTWVFLLESLASNIIIIPLLFLQMGYLIACAYGILILKWVLQIRAMLCCRLSGCASIQENRQLDWTHLNLRISSCKEKPLFFGGLQIEMRT